MDKPPQNATTPNKVKPKCVVLVMPGADIHPESQQHDEQAKPQRHEFSQLPRRVGFTEKKWRHVHTHVPDRYRNGHGQERQPVAPQHDRTARKCREFHKHPTPVNVCVVFAENRSLSPPAQCGLHAIDCQGREDHHKGCRDACGNRQVAAVQKELREPDSHSGIRKGNEEQSPSTEAFPSERRLQRLVR